MTPLPASLRPFVAAALLALVSFVLAFPVILQTLNGPHPFQGLRGAPALPQQVSLGVVFVLVTAVTVLSGFPIALILRRLRRNVWPNSARVVDWIHNLRAPLIAAVCAYGVANSANARSSVLASRTSNDSTCNCSASATPARVAASSIAVPTAISPLVIPAYDILSADADPTGASSTRISSP